MKQYIPDYNDLINRYEEEKEREVKMLPKCSCCGEPIFQDSAVVFEDEWFCDNCLTEYYRKDIEEYI